ncbi:MAG: sugar kinase [Opitutaceae bacterium]|nr:sugar kinase [Opitutaceae bacterium]
MNNILCLGEILLRMSPPFGLRLTQALPGSLIATFAGAEANVAVTIAQLGGNATFLTALPDNPVARSCLAEIRAAGVDTSRVLLRGNGRMGIFYLEHGAGPRGGQVVYDRDGSVFAETPAAAYPWTEIFRDKTRFHTSGISPALSASSAALTLHALRAAREAGLSTSCDINHRRKLWNWDASRSPERLARDTHLQNLPFVETLIGNPYDLAMLLEKQPAAGPARCGELARQLAAEHPQLRRVAITLRQTLSSDENTFGALLYSRETDACVLSPRASGGGLSPHRVTGIVDRVGTGDAFAGALLRALGDGNLSAQDALDYATAAAALAHTVRGDYPYLPHAEVLGFSKGDATAHLSR